MTKNEGFVSAKTPLVFQVFEVIVEEEDDQLPGPMCDS